MATAAAHPAVAAGGILLCALIASAAFGLAEIAPVPAVLTALLLGFAARPVAAHLGDSAGVSFCARTLLRLGIALMGVRLSLGDLVAFGWPALWLGIGAVVLMLTAGVVIGRAFDLAPGRAALSAGSVGICGASAALAVSAVLPRDRRLESQTVFTICTVTILSTIAMLLYPVVTRALGMGDIPAGMFFGAAIHDLTQVLGAGAMISPDATEAATVTKLVRVACLAPAAIAVGLCFGAHRSAGQDGAGERPPLLPWFIIGFVLLAVAANIGALPGATIPVASEAATLCLVAATAALGLKTSPRALFADGWRPLAAMIAQTLLLAAAALAAISLLA